MEVARLGGCVGYCSVYSANALCGRWAGHKSIHAENVVSGCQQICASCIRASPMNRLVESFKVSTPPPQPEEPQSLISGAMTRESIVAESSLPVTFQSGPYRNGIHVLGTSAYVASVCCVAFAQPPPIASPRVVNTQDRLAM